MYANLSINDFKKIKKILKVTKCRANVLSKRGIPFILNKYRKRKIFLGCLLSIILCLIITSNFVWNIEIVGNVNIKTEEIIESLAQEGLEIGKAKGQIDTKKIINNIRLSRNDIAWIGITLDGTNARVEIVERKEKPDIISEDEYCNIVSDKKGIITKISAQNGTIVANVGDVVQEGSVLVAGWLEGKYTGVRYVHARADIEAKVWYSKSQKAYYKQIVEVKTGKSENKYSMRFLANGKLPNCQTISGVSKR